MMFSRHQTARAAPLFAKTRRSAIDAVASI